MLNLKGMRNKANMTQGKVAELLNISTETYSSWEREKYDLSFVQAIQLADLFNCSLDELAGRKRATVLTMEEPPVRTRIRNAFDQLNHAGREALAQVAELYLKTPAFVDSPSGGKSGGGHTIQQVAG